MSSPERLTNEELAILNPLIDELGKAIRSQDDRQKVIMGLLYTMINMTKVVGTLNMIELTGVFDLASKYIYYSRYILPKSSDGFIDPTQTAYYVA